MMDTSSSAFEGQLVIAVHELMHALGFSSGSWPLFRSADGTPMTPREPDGLPATENVQCVDGSTRQETAVSINTLVVETSPRGSIVNKLVTPRVVQVAKDILG